MEREIEVAFTNDIKDIYYINVFSVVRGTDDLFIKLGSIMPILQANEEVNKIEVKPLIVFTSTKSSLKEFVKLLQEKLDEEDIKEA